MDPRARKSAPEPSLDFSSRTPQIGREGRNRPQTDELGLRLAAVAALHAGGEESFSNLKKVVGATDGNLTIHMKVLAESGIVTVRKRFVDRRPRTTYRLTRKGRQVFREYVACMARMVEQYDHQMIPRD